MAERVVSASIFNVPIEGENVQTILDQVSHTKRGLWIITANPEILLEARRNARYKEIIRQADTRTVDGFGLLLALKMLRRPVSRLTGVELAEHLLQYAWKRGLRVGFFGGEGGEALDAAKEIRESYAGLQLHVEEGARVSLEGEEDAATEEARMRMIQFGPDILLVALGAPRQESWIAKHRQDFPELKAIVGVGGTFTFWAGRIQRAPLWMRSFGLEWLWRLIQEPKRWRRIWNAAIVFPACFFHDKFLK